MRLQLVLLALAMHITCVAGVAQVAETDESIRRVRVGITGGLGLLSAGSRYSGTSPGGLVEGTLRYDITDRWQVGIGGTWGTFGGSVPQFAIFEPFDHDPWLEYTSVFAEARFVAKRDAPMGVFFSGRAGRMSELAEYAGATVRRAGLTASAITGLRVGLWSSFAAEISGLFGLTRFGAGQLNQVMGVEPPPSTAAQFGARIGVEVGIGR